MMVPPILLLLLWPSVSSSTADAFVPKNVGGRAHVFGVNGVTGRGGGSTSESGSRPPHDVYTRASSSDLFSTAAEPSVVVKVPTKAIQGMKPGTSGLRKKVEVWQGLVDPDTNKHYVENFIQSLIDTAVAKNNNEMLQTLIVAGDGRYFNTEAIPKICHVLAGNGVKNIWVPQQGIMSTPAVSAAIRTRTVGDMKAQGGIILTASHNPGGPGEDFGIKYNEEYGQPAGEDFTDELYERSLKIESFKTIKEKDDNGALPETIDLSAPVGTTFQLTPSSSVTIIDPFTEYVSVLKECFDFDAIQQFVSKRPDFQILFDGMHGAGGPFARRVLMEELGFPESSLMRCDPRPDFGKCHPDPNLTYASELVKKMGLKSDGSADEASTATAPTLGAANDGDGDRNLIAGAGCFVTPSDSLAMICDNWRAIPHFAKAGGPKGVARSMPSSAALDVVADALEIPFFSTPTGWKFFGNLMGSKEQFGKTDYTPFLCGEESFGTGSDHIREKDGLWAMLAWISILMNANEGKTADEPLVQVRDIVKNHWAKYGRHFYCRYDYETVDSDAANKMMDLIRDDFVNGDISALPDDPSGIKLVGAEEFSYTDPVDGSTTNKQGIIMNYEYSNGDAARVVFRLSGTGSAGATIRCYLEKYEKDTAKHHEAAPVALKSLADRAVAMVQLQEFTGREAPSVIT